MKIFFDLEFTGLHQDTTPISIGLVTEDNHEFYAEFIDFDDAQVDEWIQQNVIQNLFLECNPPNTPTVYQPTDYRIEMIGPKMVIRNVLTEWIGRYSEIELWGDCLAYDWILFCELFGGALSIPKNIYYIPFDLCTLLKLRGYDPDVNREQLAGIDTNGPKHNALWDAKVIRACYDRIEAERE